MKKPFYYITIMIAAVLLVLPLYASSQVPSFGSPIVDAADKGDVNQVERLIKEGAFVDETGDFKVTALMRAAFRGNKQIADMLIKAGADVNAQDIGGASPMHMAARAGKTEIINLLMQHKANVDVKDEEGWTPLMRASNAGKPEAVETLLKSGANPNQKNAWDESSLIYAVKRGNLKVAETLMGAGAKPEGKDADGRTITQLAELSKNSELKQLIAAPAPTAAAPVAASAQVTAAKPETIADAKLPEQVAPPPAATLEARQEPKPQTPVQQPPKTEVIATPAPAPAPAPAPVAAPETKPEAKAEEPKKEKSLWRKIFREKDEPAPVEEISNSTSTPSKPAEVKKEIKAVTPPEKLAEPEATLSPSAPPASIPVKEEVKIAQEKDLAKEEKKETKPAERNFLIQVGFFQEADKEKAGSRMHEIWEEKSKAHPEIFKNLTAVVTGVKLDGQNDLYRVRAGYFEKREDAEDSCKKIGEGCVVIRSSAAEQERSLEAEKELLAGKEKKPEPEAKKEEEPKPQPKEEPKGKIESALVEKLQTAPPIAAPAPVAAPVTAPAPAAIPAAPKAEKQIAKKAAKGKKAKDEVTATKELNSRQLEGAPVAAPAPTPAIQPEPAKADSSPASKPSAKKDEVVATKELNSRQLDNAPATVQVPAPAAKAETVKAEPEKPAVKPEILAEAPKTEPVKQAPVAVAAPAQPEVKPAPEIKKEEKAKPEPVQKKARIKPAKELEETKRLNASQLPEAAAAIPASVPSPTSATVEAKPEPRNKLSKEEKKTKDLNDRQLAAEPAPAPSVPPAAAPLKTEPLPSKPLQVAGKAKPKGNEVEATKQLNSQQLEAPVTAAAPSAAPAPIKQIEPQAQQPQSTVKFLDAAPVKPAGEGEVEVMEAIRVPLSESGIKKPEYFIAAEKPTYSYGDIIVELFWFDSEAAAKAFAADFKANRPDLINEKNISTKPHESGKFMLAIGPFGTVGESQEVCRIAKSAGLYCSTQKVLQGMSGNRARFPANAELKGKFWALLGGYQSAREAGDAFLALQPQIPAEFKSVRHDIKSSRSGRGKIYRLRAGEFNNRSEADHFCSTIESVADLCQVVEE